MPTKKLRTNLILTYNRHAEQRDRSEIQDWKVSERAAFLDLLKRERKKTLLEMGAGHGRDSQFFQENGLQVTCIDLSPEMVKLCQQKGLNARIMDIVDLDFADHSFDGIYSLNSMLHLAKKEWPIAVQNIRRVLSGNGLFFLGVYGGYDFEGIWEQDSYHPERFYAFHTDENLQQVVAESFELLSFKRIELRLGDLHFQSLILRKSVAQKEMSRLSSARCAGDQPGRTAFCLTTPPGLHSANPEIPFPAA